jgi:hypothetical protein
LLERHAIVALTKLQDRLVFTFTDAVKFLAATQSVQRRLRLIDDRTAHLLLEKNEHAPAALVAMLKRLLSPAEPSLKTPPLVPMGPRGPEGRTVQDEGRDKGGPSQTRGKSPSASRGH